MVGYVEQVVRGGTGGKGANDVKSTDTHSSAYAKPGCYGKVFSGVYGVYLVPHGYGANKPMWVFYWNNKQTIVNGSVPAAVNIPGYHRIIFTRKIANNSKL